METEVRKTSSLARATGSAMMWRGTQIAGTKFIYLVRKLVLARLLAPDDFGVLAIVFVAVEFLTVITNIGLTSALVQRQKAEDGHYDAAWTIGMLRALVVAAGIFLSAPLFAQLFQQPRTLPFVQAAALIPLIDAAASIKLTHLARNLSFRAMSLARLLDVTTNTLLSIFLPPVPGMWAVIVGSLAGPFVYVVMSYWLAPYRPRLVFEWENARPLIRFGRWVFLAGVVAMIGRTAMQIIISRQLGAAELGVYFLATKLAFMPMDVSREVVNAVAFPLYAKLQQETGQLVRAYRAILVGLTALIVPLCVLLSALTPALVSYLLGPDWQGAVPMIRIMVLVGILGLIGDTVTPLLNAAGQPQKVAIIELLQASLLIAFSALLVANFDLLGAALAWLPAIGASQLLSAFFARQILPQPFRGTAGSVITIGLVAHAGGGMAASIVLLWPGLVGMVFASATAAAAMIVLLWQADRTFRLGLQTNLVRAFPPLARLKLLNQQSS